MFLYAHETFPDCAISVMGAPWRAELFLFQNKTLMADRLKVMMPRGATHVRLCCLHVDFESLSPVLRKLFLVLGGLERLMAAQSPG